MDSRMHTPRDNQRDSYLETFNSLVKMSASCGYMPKVNDFVLNQAPNIVVPYINVLVSQTLNWIF